MEHFVVGSGSGVSRMRAWNDLACETLGHMEVVAAKASSFCGRIDRVRHKDINVARIYSDPVQVYGQIELRPEKARYLILQCESGLHKITQDGQSLILGAGDLTVLRTDWPYLVDIDASNICSAATIPSDIADVDWGASVSRCFKQAEVPVISTLIKQSVGGFQKTPAHAYSATLARIFRDALYLTWPSSTPTQEQEILLDGRWQVAIEAYVAANLENSDLNAATIGAHLGISGRYVQMVVSRQGITVSKYIQERRLRAASQRLRDEPWVSVTTVALEAGFNDISHFSRVFRAKFGQSAREWRKKR